MGGALSSNVHEVFDRFDANHDGTIDESELATALRMIYNARTTSAVCRELIATADLNNDGVLERHEFVQFVSNFGDLLPARADEADDASELVRVAFSSSRPPGFKCRGALVSSATGDAEEAGVMAGMRVARVHARAVARDDDVNTIVDDHRAAMPVFTVTFVAAGGGGGGGEGGAAALVTTALATDAGPSARAADDGGDGAGGQEDAEEVGDTAEGLTDIGEVGGDVDREETDLSTPFLLLSLAGAKLGINLKMSVEWKLVRVAWGWTRWLCAFAFSFPNTPDGFGAVLGIAGGLLLPVAVWLRLSFLNRQTENKWDHERKLVCCCERNKWGAASVGLWLLVLAGASSGAGGGESIWFAGFVGFVGVATAYHGLVMLARQNYYNVVRSTTARTQWRETYWHGVVAVEGAAIFFMFLMSFTVGVNMAIDLFIRALAYDAGGAGWNAACATLSGAMLLVYIFVPLYLIHDLAKVVKATQPQKFTQQAKELQRAKAQARPRRAPHPPRRHAARLTRAARSPPRALSPRAPAAARRARRHDGSDGDAAGARGPSESGAALLHEEVGQGTPAADGRGGRRE